MKMKDVLNEELEVISVPRSEVLRLKGIANGFIKKLKEDGLRAYIGGSLAKGTLIWKLDRQDVDIFVVFDYSEDIVELEGILKKIELPGKLKKIHGSRDYFQIVCDPQLDSFGHQTGQGLTLEVIPVVKNLDPELAENVTDVSLRHVKYVAGEIRKKPGIADEIRLAKAFCRAQKCYGAEGYIRGFSGYSLEILVIYFGSFVKFLKGINRTRVIDSMKYFKGEREIMRELNSSKLNGPIVVVDPTYKFRNVCAGLGMESFEKFLEVAKDFLKKPSLEFFEMKELDVEELKEFSKKKGARFLELELKTDRQEGDIAGTKMKKILRFFVEELGRQGQEVLRREFDYSGKKKARGFLVVKENSVVETRGPSVGLEEQAKKFCEAKRDAVFKKKGFWWWRRTVSVESVLGFVKRFEEDMGAEIRKI